MNRSALAIATIVISILSGCSGAAPAATPTPTRLPTPTPAPTATPTPTASPAPTPTASAQSGPRELPAGALQARITYTGAFEGVTRYTFTFPASGWNNYPEAGCCVIYKGGDADGAIIFFTGDITSLYAEACHSSGTEFSFGPAVDDLATALVSLQDFEVSEPTDVTLSGFHGKRVKVTVPMDVDVTNPECDNGEYSLYDDVALGFAKGDESGNLPEATLLLWSFPAGTEFDARLATVQIEDPDQ